MLVHVSNRARGNTNLIVVCVLVAVACLVIIGGSATYIMYNMPADQKGAEVIKPPPDAAPPGDQSAPPSAPPQGAGPQVGQPAPEIVGKDSEGKEFKLSDYRGKVVVLDFWAGWCGPCMALVPHNKEIVKRMEGKPFVFLGVNLDNTADAAKKVETANDINWRSFFDGRGGPISRAWGIQFIPTIWVIDHKGVLRYQNVKGKQLDDAIEKLVAEVGAEPKNGGSTGN